MQNFVRFLKELRAYRRVMLFIILLTLITSSLSLPMPIIIQYLTDHLSDIAMQKNPGQHLNLIGIFAIIVVVAATSALAGYWLTYSISYLGQMFKLDMRRKLYGHMQTLSLGFFEKSQTGKLMSNITNDVATLDQLIGGGFVNVMQDLVTLLAVFGYIFYLNWKLALVSLIVFPIYILNY